MGTELPVSAVHDSIIILNLYYFIISISITHDWDIHFYDINSPLIIIKIKNSKHLISELN